jgi:2-dehydropantoate 2-reductase
VTQPDFQRVAIVGAGAIGGWLGVLLSHTGCIVSALARGDTLAALQRDGLQLHENGRLIGAPVEASSSAAALGVQDLVIVAVKAPALVEVARSIAPLIGRHTVVLTAMNGVPWWFFNGFGGARAGTRLQSVDPTGAIDRAIPARNVIGGVVHASCSVDAPGVIRHHFGNGLIIGAKPASAWPRWPRCCSAPGSTPACRRRSRKTSGTSSGAT